MIKLKLDGLLDEFYRGEICFRYSQICAYAPFLLDKIKGRSADSDRKVTLREHGKTVLKVLKEWGRETDFLVASRKGQFSTYEIDPNMYWGKRELLLRNKIIDQTPSHMPSIEEVADVCFKEGTS